MFDKCYSLEKIDLSMFDIRNVTDIRSFFEDCKSLTEIDLSNFNGTKLDSLRSSRMFETNGPNATIKYNPNIIGKDLEKNSNRLEKNKYNRSFCLNN